MPRFKLQCGREVQLVFAGDEGPNVPSSELSSHPWLFFDGWWFHIQYSYKEARAHLSLDGVTADMPIMLIMGSRKSVPGSFVDE